MTWYHLLIRKLNATSCEETYPDRDQIDGAKQQLQIFILQSSMVNFLRLAFSG
jgi:hypothetical protein